MLRHASCCCCCPLSVNRGYIVDVSLKGTSVEPDTDDMEAAYGEGTTPADVLQVGVQHTAVLPALHVLQLRLRCMLAKVASMSLILRLGLGLRRMPCGGRPRISVEGACTNEAAVPSSCARTQTRPVCRVPCRRAV